MGRVCRRLLCLQGKKQSERQGTAGQGQLQLLLQLLLQLQLL